MEAIFGVAFALVYLGETEVVGRDLLPMDWRILLGLEFREALAVRSREGEGLAAGEIGEARVGVGGQSEGTAVGWNIEGWSGGL